MSSVPRKKERSSDGSTGIVCKLPGCKRPTWPNDRELETARTYHHQRYHQESARIVYQGRSVEIRRDPATGKFPCPCGEPQHARRMAINIRTLCKARVHPPPDTLAAGEAGTDDEGFGSRRGLWSHSSAAGGPRKHASESDAEADATARRTRSAASSSASSRQPAPLPCKRRRESPDVIELDDDDDEEGTVLVKRIPAAASLKRMPASPKRVKREPAVRRSVSASPNVEEEQSNDAKPVAEDDAEPATEGAAREHQEPEPERELTLEEKFERNRALERKLHEQLDKQYEAYQEKLRAMQALMS